MKTFSLKNTALKTAALALASLFSLGASEAQAPDADTAPLPAEGVTLSEEQLDKHALYHIEGVFIADGSLEQVWKVLSDYEGLKGVISSLKTSIVHSRSEEGTVIEQVMEGHFLIFSKPLEIFLLARETPHKRIDFEETQCIPFPYYKGSWELEPLESGTLVRYTLRVSRGEMAPQFIERGLFRDNAAEMLKELKEEVARRAASLPAESKKS